MGAAVDAERVVHELFRTPEGRRDPHPHYHRLRAAAPVHRSESLHAWVLTGYEDCRAVLRDPRFARRFVEVLDAHSAHWRGHTSLGFASRSMLMLDPPDHTRLRARVARTFTPRAVAALRPSVERRVHTLLDDFVASGGGDLMDRLAFRLPVMVIGDVLGVPPEDLDSFRDPVIALTAAFEVPATREALDRADEAYTACAAYFGDLVAQRRRTPTDDLLGRLAAPGDDPLDDGELVDLAILLFVAGFETTTNLIGNGVLAFHDEPAQFELLRTDPSVHENLADELLRHSTTVQLTSRVPLEDVDVGGVTVPAGETAFVMIGAANRDPARYPDPDRLDLRRTAILPLAFGGGIHHCLGAALASLEIEVLFTELARRVERLELTGPRPEPRDRLVIWSTPSIEVRLPARQVAGIDPEVIAARPSGGDAAWRRAYRERLEREASPVAAAELAVRVALLRSNDFFARCTPGELASLAGTAYPLAFEPGETLVVQGEPSPDAFVIAEGGAEVRIDGERVGEVGHDDLVGERGVVTGTARAATVTATSHLAAYVLSRDRLRAVMEANPEAAEHMRAVVARY